MRSLLLVCALLMLVLTVGCQKNEQPKPPAAQASEAATTAIGVLQKMVNDQNFRGLGFDSVAEVGQAQLGEPMPVFDIGLDQLKAYKEGTDPNTLLAATSRTLYPVTVGGQTKSSITVTHRENGYVASSFGNADIMKSLSRYRQTQTGGGDFVVRVPAFSMYYLGRRIENRLLLVPIIDDPRLKLKSGEAVAANVVLAQLVPLANGYNGLPM
jgi:hypothetical protein